MIGAIQTLVSKLAAFRGQLAYLPRTLPLLRAGGGGTLLAWVVLLVAQGVLPAAVVLLSKLFVDTLTAVLGSSQRSDGQLMHLLLIAGAIATIMLAIEALRVTTTWLRARLSGLVEDRVSDLIHRKSTEVDMAFYDTAEYHDHLHRARDEARYRPVALLENAASLLQNGITLLAMAAVLLPYGLIMPVALVLSTLPALYIIVRHAVREHDWRRRSSEAERRSDYLSWMMTSAHSAAEMRLFELGTKFRSAHSAIRAHLRGERLQLVAQQGWSDLWASLGAFLVATACLAWVGWRATQGLATLGDLVLFYQAFNQGQRLMRTLLASVGQLYYNTLFLGNLFEFLDLKVSVQSPSVASPPPVGRTDVRAEGAAAVVPTVKFQAVTFDYPGTTCRALDSLNLELEAGKITAIVGANGAGKSTLVKLLCRFYDPQSGRVLLGDTDVREMSLESLRQRITVLFQEPVRFQATVAENISPNTASKTGATDRDHEAATAAGANAFIRSLPKGMETQLGRWFADGVELSGGQWQRVALARAFARDSSVVVLDEPTSAMDSWAESEWLQRFRTVVRGRTALIITHRFTTAMQADVIHVMDKGRIVESGSHSQLLQQGGAYADSWNAQMRAEQGLR